MLEKFEEYKLLNERAQKLSERRQTTTQTYLTIITAIFGALAFLGTQSVIKGWGLILILVPLFLVGIIACSIWLQITNKIEAFLNWQYECLREMEHEIPTTFKTLTRENKKFYQDGPRNKKFSFTLQEAWLPRLLIILFTVYGIVMIVSVLLGKL